MGVLGPQAAVGAHGDDPDVDYEPVYQACVGAATESAGFEDTVGLSTEDQINCLGHYGITQGRTATTFAPRESVLRWQMALFMARAASAAGIVLENPAEDQGFTDIGAVSEEAQNAINGLAKMGIMPGVSQTQFSPNSSVTRGSMANILDQFLTNARLGAGALGQELDSYSDVKSDSTNAFTDLNTVPLLTYNAVFRIYEVGVTQGTGDHQYSPGDLVTRAQMAAFIMRTLAHTVARPAGVSVQAAQDSVLGAQNVELLVSVRDTAFQPMVDAKVDVFSSTDPDEAFKDDGTCDTGNVARVSVGSTACRVEVGDDQTDFNGDILDLQANIVDADVTVWAWTGDENDDFDNDDTTAAQLTVGFSKAASQTLVTDTLGDGQTHSKFGETVTVTLQIADEDDKPVADKGKTVVVAHRTTNADTSSTSGSSTYTTDADGKIVVNFTHADSDTTAVGQTATVMLTLSNPPAGLPLMGKGGEQEEDSAMFVKTYRWSDAAPLATSLMIAATRDKEFEAASDEGDGAQGSVTATLTDQYGDPIRGSSIVFTSDTECTPEDGETECDEPGVGPAGKRATTRRDGRAVLNYAYDSDESAIETIKASLSLTPVREMGECLDSEEDCTETDDVSSIDTPEDSPVEFYWVGDASDAPFTARVLVKDIDNDQLVVQDKANDNVMLIKYDANDQFNDLDGNPVLMADFEKPLEADADPAAGQVMVDAYESEAGKVSTFTLLPPEPPFETFGDGGFILRPDEQTGGNNNRPMAADNGVLVVGAPYETYDCDHDNDGGTTAEEECQSAGAVYIYPQGTSTDMADRVRLTPPYFLAEGYFGWDVDIAGDTIVVGSGRIGAVGNNQVYVYVRDADNAWPTTPTATFTTATAKATPGSGTVGDTGAPQNQGFGEGVAISRDGDTIAVIAPSSNNRGVRIYEKPSGGWADDTDSTSTNVLLSGSGWNNARSVAINGDGSVIVAGHCSLNSLRNHCNGWMYIYERSGNTWTALSDATARVWTNGGFQANEGWDYARSVAVSDDGNVVVASTAFDSRVTDKAGLAQVYVKQSSGWMPTHVDHLPGGRDNTALPLGFELMAPDSSDADRFGRYVAISSDGSKIAVSHQNRADVDDRGAVLVFNMPDGGWPGLTDLDDGTDNKPDSDNTPDMTFAGPYDGLMFGLEVTFDKSNDDLYAAASAVGDGTYEYNGVASTSDDPLPIWGLASDS